MQMADDGTVASTGLPLVAEPTKQAAARSRSRSPVKDQKSEPKRERKKEDTTPVIRENGDLLTWKGDCIVQQCNCLAVRPHGLSALIAKAKPYADVYSKRTQAGGQNLADSKTRSVPGTVDLFSPPTSTPDQPVVACLYGQWDMGRPLKYKRSNRPEHVDEKKESKPDTGSQREKWFQAGLQQLATKVQEHGWKSIAFPHGIGCGLAGGKWSVYEIAIKEFATGLSHCRVYILKK
jgi:O-acetyl-ADP-ribose deacetylase (regulator of RNase III)